MGSLVPMEEAKKSSSSQRENCCTLLVQYTFHDALVADSSGVTPEAAWQPDCLLRIQALARLGRAGRSMFETTRISTSEYLKKIGVAQLPPCTSPFDPGYDPATLESHLEQSSHLMSLLKVSMACWMVAKESATRQKVAAAKRHQVPTVAGGRPFEVAGALGQLPAYLDLCAGLGFQTVIFEATNKPSQFALLDHFGREVHLCNVRLEELLRVEIYRRGLHSDAFAKAYLRPLDPSREPAQAFIG